MSFEITKYPDVPLKRYKVTFDMVRRHTKGKKEFFTVTFPAVSEEAAKRAVHDFCWGINEATNHLYLTDGHRQSIKVEEVTDVSA